MNNLSWIIYLTDVIPNMGSVAGFILFWCCLAIFGLLIFLTLTQTLPTKEFGGEAEALRMRGLANKAFSRTILVTIVTVLLFIFLPSREALYMIAASEAGETIVTSPEGKEILQDLKEVLDAQLEALKSTKK